MCYTVGHVVRTEGTAVDTVFDVFDEVSYQCLVVSRGGVYGNIITASYSAVGVADIDGGMVTANNQETHQSDSLLYIYPDESFMPENPKDLVGNGIRIDDNDYEIIGFGIGRNQDEGVIEHYELTLQAADYSDYTEES